MPEIPTTPPPTPFYKTTEGIITMASACVVVLLAVVTVLLWRKHAKKRYEMKTPWHYTINCPISVDGSFPYGVTEDFIRIYKNMAVMLVILLTSGYCFSGFSSFFGILNNHRLEGSCSSWKRKLAILARNTNLQASIRKRQNAKHYQSPQKNLADVFIE